MNKLLSISIAIILCLNISAQESLDRDVEVVNTYMPTLVNPFKLQVDPVIDDTMSYKPSFNYDILQHTQAVSTTPDSLRPATMTFREDEYPYRAYVRAAGGNYTNIFGEIFYNIGMNEGDHLALNAGHHSMLGKVKLDDDSKVKAPQSNTWAKADYHNYFEKTTLAASLAFINNRYRYYGLNTIDPEANYIGELGETVTGEELLPDEQQANNTFDLDVSFGTTNPYTDKTSYLFSAGFGTFGNKTDIGQFDLRFGAFVNVPFKKSFFFDAKLDFNYFKVSTPIESTNLYTFNERKNADITITPHIGLDYSIIHMALGFNLIFDIGGEEDNIYMQPDLNVNINVADDIFSLYFALSGVFKNNSFRQLVQENRYISPDACSYVWKSHDKEFIETHEMPSSEYPMRFIGGVKVLFCPKVEMNLGVEYHNFEDEFFYVNRGFTREEGTSTDYTNLFGIITEDGKLFTFNGEVGIRPTSNSLIIVRGKYNNWNLNYLDEPWYKPKYELGADARFYPMERLLMTVGFNVLGKRYAYNQTTQDKQALDALFDINVGAEYYITSRWTAFLTLNNCATQDYQRWLGYSSYRFNLLLGATFKF